MEEEQGRRAGERGGGRGKREGGGGVGGKRDVRGDQGRGSRGATALSAPRRRRRRRRSSSSSSSRSRRDLPRRVAVPRRPPQEHDAAGPGALAEPGGGQRAEGARAPGDDRGRPGRGRKRGSGRERRRRGAGARRRKERGPPDCPLGRADSKRRRGRRSDRSRGGRRRACRRRHPVLARGVESEVPRLRRRAPRRGPDGGSRSSTSSLSLAAAAAEAAAEAAARAEPDDGGRRSRRRRARGRRGFASSLPDPRPDPQGGEGDGGGVPGSGRAGEEPPPLPPQQSPRRRAGRRRRGGDDDELQLELKVDPRSPSPPSPGHPPLPAPRPLGGERFRNRPLLLVERSGNSRQFLFGVGKRKRGGRGARSGERGGAERGGGAPPLEVEVEVGRRGRCCGGAPFSLLLDFGRSKVDAPHGKRGAIDVVAVERCVDAVLLSDRARSGRESGGRSVVDGQGAKKKNRGSGALRRRRLCCRSGSSSSSSSSRERRGDDCRVRPTKARRVGRHGDRGRPERGGCWASSASLPPREEREARKRQAFFCLAAAVVSDGRRRRRKDISPSTSSSASHRHSPLGTRDGNKELVASTY